MLRVSKFKIGSRTRGKAFTQRCGVARGGCLVENGGLLVAISQPLCQLCGIKIDRLVGINDCTMNVERRRWFGEEEMAGGEEVWGLSFESSWLLKCGSLPKLGAADQGRRYGPESNRLRKWGGGCEGEGLDNSKRWGAKAKPF